MLNTELRPLGAGELLDRAVTIFVRHFVPIVVVLAVAVVPLVVIEAFISPRSSHVFSDIGRVFSTATDPAASRAAQKILESDSPAFGLTALLFVVSICVRLLEWSAIVTVVANAYAGAPTTIAQAYAVGLRRWPQQLLIALVFVALGVVAAIPLMILYVIVILAVIALAALQQTIATVVIGVIGVLILIAGFAVVGSWVFMTYELAAVAVVTETRNAIDAIGAGLRRGAASGMRRRTIVAGLVVFLVSQAGALPLIGIAAVATALSHIDALYFAILGAGSVLLRRAHRRLRGGLRRRPARAARRDRHRRGAAASDRLRAPWTHGDPRDIAHRILADGRYQTAPQRPGEKPWWSCSSTRWTSSGGG